MNIKKYYKEENYIHYSNCHEDFLMLKKYLKPGAKRVLSIASGLDNSLAFLVNSDVKVVAFDNNPSQIFLCKLKLEGIKHLSYEDFLILLGINDGDRLKLYKQVYNYLDEYTKNYFDKHLFLIEMGLIHIGRFEYFFRLFRKKVFPLLSGEKNIRYFSNIATIEEQREYFKKHIATRRFNFVFKLFFSKKMMSKTGRDEKYFKYSKGHLHTLLRDRVEQGFTTHLNKDNPYYNYVLKNTYEAKPLYLKEENFYKIKENITNIEIVQADFKDMLNEKYDFMNLSDLFEYMSEEDMPSYEENVFNALNHNGIVAFWNMMNVRNFKKHQRINNENEIIDDRAFFYRDFLVYEKN